MSAGFNLLAIPHTLLFMSSRNKELECRSRTGKRRHLTDIDTYELVQTVSVRGIVRGCLPLISAMAGALSLVILISWGQQLLAEAAETSPWKASIYTLLCYLCLLQKQTSTSIEKLGISCILSSLYDSFLALYPTLTYIIGHISKFWLFYFVSGISGMVGTFSKTGF